jgi:hypothetical protein
MRLLSRLKFAVSTAKIADLAVGTLKIADQAVTIPVSVYTAGSTTFNASEQTIQSVTITSTGAPVEILACCSYKRTSGSGLNINDFFIYRGTTLIYKVDNVEGGITGLIANIAISDTPGAGTHTYYFKGAIESGGTTVTCASRYMRLLETKK